MTNNLTEMLALVIGLSFVPADWHFRVYSDSQVTLGRAFQGWKWKGIPDWLYGRFGYEAHRLEHWGEATYVRLDGHPTQAQLAAGVGKRGGPVSIHNVWCDKACGEAARSYLSKPGYPTLKIRSTQAAAA